MNLKFEKKQAHRLYRFMHNFHYPKITFLILLIFLSYYIFRNPVIYDFFSGLNELSYLGVFLAGILFAFGFTTPFAVGFFIVLKPENLFLAGVIGGLGAMISNIFIFRFIRFTFLDEFYRLEHTKPIKKFIKLIENNFGHKACLYLMYIFSGVVIVSPLPDEIGVMMLAGIKSIPMGIFSIATFILSTTGISLLLRI
jgi:hypothetical protein